MTSSLEFLKKKAEEAKARIEATKAADAANGDPGGLHSAADVPGSIPATSVNSKKSRGLMPLHHPNRDFFMCDILDYALKDDGVSMEAPLFTLATKPDLSVWHWESRDGKKSVTVTPSVQGRATQFDKDLLIFVVSQVTAALNQKRLDANNPTVRFRVHDYLVTTNRRTGGKEYVRLQESLSRLRGTTIKTNIQTGGQRISEGFGVIDRWRIVERSPGDDRMIAVEVKLSDWLFNAVQAHEVLTISPDYFRLRKPIERRLYELARKHCGEQGRFRIGVALLQNKCGSQASIREFRRSLRSIEESNTLPGYSLTLDTEADQVFFLRKAG